jgi:hypothetical protein
VSKKRARLGRASDRQWRLVRERRQGRERGRRRGVEAEQAAGRAVGEVERAVGAERQAFRVGRAQTVGMTVEASARFTNGIPTAAESASSWRCLARTASCLETTIWRTCSGNLLFAFSMDELSDRTYSSMRRRAQKSRLVSTNCPSIYKTEGHTSIRAPGISRQ